MRDHLVDDDLEPEAVCARDERVEVAERAEDRVDPPVVRHVIAEVLHRRGEEGRQPHRVHAEAFARGHGLLPVIRFRCFGLYAQEFRLRLL